MVSRKAFTLIELLIVVAIIAILAAIAVPNFLEAQVRAKVSRVKADMAATGTALEAYAVDYNGYPYQNPNSRVLKVGAIKALEVITTPVAYMTSVPANDPFRGIGSYSGTNMDSYSDFGSGTEEYEKTYYMYSARNSRMEGGAEGASWDRNLPSLQSGKVTWWILGSNGPEGKGYGLRTGLKSVGANPGDAEKARCLAVIYDPTNGTVSKGSVYRVGGQPGGKGAIFFHLVQGANK